KKAIRVYNSAPQTEQADGGWSLDEMLMDANTKTPDCEMVEADDLPHVKDLLDKMDKREATVVPMRFGLDDEEPKTLKEIGECLGLTRERVRQIESEALSQLSQSLQAECRTFDAYTIPPVGVTPRCHWQGPVCFLLLSSLFFRQDNHGE